MLEEWRIRLGFMFYGAVMGFFIGMIVGLSIR